MASPVTILTTCKNRNEFLYEVLPNWLEYQLPIVVIDYSSDEPLSINHPLVTVHRFDGYEYFNLCHALNLGFNRVETDLVLRIDCDVYLKKEDVWSAVDRIQRNQYMPHKLNWKEIGTGTMMMWTDDFFMLNGYQEFCKGWGYDDVDFNRRLHKIGRHHNGDLLPTIIMHQTRKEVSANYSLKHCWISNFLNIWRCKVYENHVHELVANYNEPIAQKKPIGFINACPVRIYDAFDKEIDPLEMLRLVYRDDEICYRAIKQMKATGWLFVSCLCDLGCFVQRFKDTFRILQSQNVIKTRRVSCQKFTITFPCQNTRHGK